MSAAAYRVPRDIKSSLGVVAVLAVLAWLIDDGVTAVALMTIAIPIVIQAMRRIPLRHSMLGLMFFALTLPNPNEGFPWAPATAPFEKVGWLLTAHWNTVDRSASWLSPAIWSGLDIFFLSLGIIAYRRKHMRFRLDYAGAVAAPEPMKQLALLSIASTLFVWLSGLVRGGNFSMSLWQVNSVIYLPIVVLLFNEAIRGPQDFAAVLRVLCAAAVYRSAFACFVINVFTKEKPDDTGSVKLAYATSHADSMLFALALIALFVLFLERLVRKDKRNQVLGLGAVFLVGMVSNNRRLVWVHVAACLMTVYLITADNPIKKKLRRVMYALTPFVIAYTIAGWNSQYGSLYKPVRTLRSVIDTKTDRTGSSFWRELENFNLVSTLRNNQLFGTGYGHPFEEIVPLPQVAYDLERYCPHNSILGLWAYGGYLGFATVTLMWVAGVYYAMRGYRNSRDPVVRAGAMTSILGILIYIMHSWGDLGLGTWTGVFIAGASIAIAGKASEAAALAPAQPVKPRSPGA